MLDCRNFCHIIQRQHFVKYHEETARMLKMINKIKMHETKNTKVYCNKRMKWPLT